MNCYESMIEYLCSEKDYQFQDHALAAEQLESSCAVDADEPAFEMTDKEYRKWAQTLSDPDCFDWSAEWEDLKAARESWCKKADMTPKPSQVDPYDLPAEFENCGPKAPTGTSEALSTMMEMRKDAEPEIPNRLMVYHNEKTIEGEHVSTGPSELILAKRLLLKAFMYLNHPKVQEIKFADPACELAEQIAKFLVDWKVE